MEKLDLLLEIGTEEIPVKFLNPAIEQLDNSIKKMLESERLNFSEVKTYYTPRRLAILVKGIDEAQEDKKIEIKGPPKRAAFSDIGRPTPAALGFANNAGLKVEDLMVKNTNKGEYLFAFKLLVGKPTKDILKEKLPEIIKKINFNKSMIWETSNLRFARPIRWILALFGNEKIKFKLSNISSSNFSLGLRCDGPPSIFIDEPAQYEEALSDNSIIVDFNKRKTMIKDQIAKLSSDLNGEVLMPEELLDEVTNLVEFPQALKCSFKEEYLTLPEDVLANVMIKHQRYFPIKGEKGLLPYFITIANGPNLNIENVIDGNERVIEARLSDGKFYFLEDQKISIFDYSKKLDTVTFHKKLGTLRQKVERIKKLTNILVEDFNFSPDEIEKEKEILEKSCELCKADLQTYMVFEFPELQGRMGQVYAQSECIDEKISNAIWEHYLPRYRGDITPDSVEGQILCLADRIDTITGGFIGGMKPTGSQDPFALRRSAFSLIENCLENKINFNLRKLIQYSIEFYSEELEIEDNDVLKQEIFEFILQRLETSLKDRGIRYDTIDALYSIGINDIYNIHKRAIALEEIRDEEAFIQIITPAKRTTNILKKEKKNEFIKISTALFEKDIEKEVFETSNIIGENVEKFLLAEEYINAFKELLKINSVIDQYFEDVHVMHDDENIKNNRIAQIKIISNLFKQIADLSKLVIEVTEK